MKICFLISLFFMAMNQAVKADYEMPLLRRVAVFPISGVVGTASEDAWWQMRELLTKDQKYLVAAKRFMINRGVFQARENLKPADAIILGKILEAQTLITSWVNDRVLYFSVYEGETGLLLWEARREFDPALPINEQLVKVSADLITHFILAVPYQGFQLLDESIGKVVFERDAKKFALAFIGLNSQMKVGDQARWIKILGDPSQAIMSKAAKIEILAEGVISKVQEDKVEIEIQKWSNLSELKENSLIQFPKEWARNKEHYAKTDRAAELALEYLSAEIKKVEKTPPETNSTSTALAFIVSFAGFLLLAF